MKDREFRIRYGSRSWYIAGAALMGLEGLVFLILLLTGVFPTIIPILLIVFLVSPLWVWKFLRGDRIRFTEDQMVSTGGKHGASVPYEDIQEVRVQGDKVEIRLRQSAGWWKRLNFGRGFRTFVLDDDTTAFITEVEARLGNIREYSLPEGGVSLVRGI